ncbi:MAG: hypothetical protein LUQ66_04480 [Methanoregula sp.]|nr:hypothetical protein [Methanoregula sp.]
MAGTDPIIIFPVSGKPGWKTCNPDKRSDDTQRVTVLKDGNRFPSKKTGAIKFAREQGADLITLGNFYAAMKIRQHDALHKK